MGARIFMTMRMIPNSPLQRNNRPTAIGAK